MNKHVLELLYKKQLESPSCMLSAMIVAYEETKDLWSTTLANDLFWKIYNDTFEYYTKINNKMLEIINKKKHE